ncbi:carboxymuconolactone decarboxylase family protein [Methanococcoides methylutens]|uniref:Putative carboxymuconolactone decarboxylase family protein n=1 Tax=Methanococcoides methylutens MM1 TaxID=1434104 RepID=A0A0E3SS89_METMT|nr:carboxymuconolactone decarboxylase family protein [Methanococcoides methylutens]AKB85348.1 putative carboxymuconolactone decarboxylase family protein [Methanococcoides methylutens MM1]
MKFLDDNLPEASKAFGDMRSAVFRTNSLDVKVKELIAVSSAVLMRCEKCVKIHSERAKENGATEEEIAEAIAVAMFIAAGSQLHWTDAYESIFEGSDE